MSNTINGGRAQWGCLLFLAVFLASFVAGLIVFGNDTPIDVTREHFDSLERNEVYSVCQENEKYTFLFAQLLFRRWEPQLGTHVIEAWRMTRSGGDTVDKIQVREIGGMWEARWCDGDKVRVITAGSYFETAADCDIEIQERSSYPVNLRRELANGR